MRIALVVFLLVLPAVLGGANKPEPPQIGYPLADVKPQELHSAFNDRRRGHRHHANDLMRPRGTPVLAVTDGKIRKLYRSKTGGISIYLFDRTEEYCFFYAHLDQYAKDLHEGQEVHQGEVIGYVGFTGNAKRNAPHLHFAVSLTGPDHKWSGGIAIDPYPLLLAAATRPPNAGEADAAAVVAKGDEGDTELPADEGGGIPSRSVVTSAP